MSTSDSKQLIAYFQQTMQSAPWALDDRQAPAHARIQQLRSDEGAGFVDLYDFKRLLLTRTDVIFAKAQQWRVPNSIANMGFTVVLAGQAELTFANIGTKVGFAAGQVWWHNGHLGAAQIHIGAQQKLQLLSLALRAPVDAWLAAAAFDPQLAPLLKSDACQLVAVDIFKRSWSKAHALMQVPSAGDAVTLLALEGAALGLLAALLAADAPVAAYAVPQSILLAGMILSAQCQQKITIRWLAKRVGLNECSLKRQFKAHYGQSIHQFLKQKRMALALELLSAGAPVHKVASACGFASTRYFCQVFLAYFGSCPHELIGSKV